MSRDHDAPRRKAVLLALLAAALFGASTPLAKAMVAGVSPQMLAGIFYLGSGAALSVFIAVRPARARHEAPLQRGQLGWLAGAIAFGGLAAPLLLLFGIAATPASSASLLINLEGVFTALIAWLVFREHVDRRIALGMLLIAGGGVALQWRQDISFSDLYGPSLITAACLAWGIDNNLMQKISTGDPVQIAAIKGVVSGTLNVTIAASLRQAWPDPLHLGGGLLLGSVSYGASFVLYVLALRTLGTARTGAYFATAPFAGAILGLALWHEPMTVPFVIAGFLMAAGVLLHVIEKHGHRHRHDESVHQHPHIHDEHHLHEHGPHDPPGEPHSHVHAHAPLEHEHPHTPDIHHRHEH